MPAGLSERDLKRAPPRPLQRQAVAARTSKRSRAARPWCWWTQELPLPRRCGALASWCTLVLWKLCECRRPVDRISRLCRESSFVVYATLPLTYIDGILAVRDSHGKPWPDTSSRTKGRCGTEDRIFCFGGNEVGGISAPVPSVVFGPSTVFSAPLKAQRQLSHGMIPVNTEPGLRILFEWRVQIY